ncbi:MAG TPA: UDP-N-acetylmuramate--L-alanine ligase [Planctomycetaceae bacterium]|jgi:UDP-N-acetylmuramate--alanine ligase
MAIAAESRLTIESTAPQTRVPAWEIPGREISGLAVPAKQSPAAYLVGVCGSGMKALAELLSAMGWNVSGSDNNASEGTAAALVSRGLRIHPGHQGRFLPKETDVLVYSPAVGPENAERQEAQRLGITQLSYSQMLGVLMRGRSGICIAGTHGKSTTTAMTGCILTAARLQPDVVIGAEVCGLGLSGWHGDGEHFVVESCEFQRSFLDLSPRYAAILGIEPDHFDCYPHFDEMIAAFAAFAQKLPATGRLLIPVGCVASKAACVAALAPLETFGVDVAADWQACDLRLTADGCRFRVFHDGDYFTEISLRIPGTHNVQNALAAAALAHMAGACPAAIREGLLEFQGICRRFERVGSWRGVTLIDDYAHHPTAVAATLAAARERFPRRRLWCVFQPHQISRTRALFDDFAKSLLAADRVLLAPVFAAREHVQDEPVQISRELAARIVAEGGDARAADTLDRALATLEDELQPGDVLITMGAGDIGKVHHAFTRRLQGHHAPRRTPGSLHLAQDRWDGAIFHHAPECGRAG